MYNSNKHPIRKLSSCVKYCIRSLSTYYVVKLVRDPKCVESRAAEVKKKSFVEKINPRNRRDIMSSAMN